MADLHHDKWMRLAVGLARRGFGRTSPNPMVGALLLKKGEIIGRGWHHAAGLPHAEIEALRDAQRRGHSPRGATLYVTLEPCCTHGRTPPCTDAIIAAGIRRVVAGVTDPNPKHAGKGFEILRRSGVEVSVLESVPSQSRRGRRQEEDSPWAKLNESFNHWVVHKTPFVTVKAAMTLDGKIGTAHGESKWITGETSRALGMKLRVGCDAILTGVNTILADDPSLTIRQIGPSSSRTIRPKPIRRIVLDSLARTPLTSRVISDEHASLTTVVVGAAAPKKRVSALAERVNVLVSPAVKALSPAAGGRSIDLRWLLKKLGAGNVASLLVEGGGEVNASFLMGGLAHRVAFFYAPKVLGGRNARKGVAGEGARSLEEILTLSQVRWRKAGGDLLMTARVDRRSGKKR